MKRLVPVLALALILVMVTWGDAFSRRHPPVRIETVQYDHPWGGDHRFNNDFPSVPTTSEQPMEDADAGISFNFILQTWFMNAFDHINFKVKLPSLIQPPVNDNHTDTDRSTNQGGAGQ